MSFPLNQSDVKILLLEGIHYSAVETLNKAGFTNVERISTALEGDELISKLSTAHFVGIRSRTQLKSEVLQHGKHLLGIGCFCIGTNQVDLETAASYGIPVFNAPHANTRSVAELVIGLTIMLMRGTFEKSQAAHNGDWLKSAVGSNEVRGKTMGIIGYGHIGSQISILAESLGMQVIYHDAYTKLPLGNANQVSLEELLHSSDIVTLHVPETDETKGMISKDVLDQMKKGSILINASRGSVVDIDALAQKLDSKHIKAAAIDVFPKEPQSKTETFQSPLRGFPQVILTPHVGGSTEEAQESIGVEVGTKFVNYFNLGSTEGSVNFPQINVPPHKNGHRIMHIHKNIPGVLRQINRLIAEEDINILAQYLETKGDIGYVVFDIESHREEELLPKLNEIEGTVRTRIFREING